MYLHISGQTDYTALELTRPGLVVQEYLKDPSYDYGINAFFGVPSRGICDGKALCKTASMISSTGMQSDGRCYVFQVDLSKQFNRWREVSSILPMLGEATVASILEYDEQSYAFLLMLGTSASADIHGREFVACYHSHAVFDTEEKRQGALDLLDCAEDFGLCVAKNRAPKKLFKKDKPLPSCVTTLCRVYPMMHTALVSLRNATEY
jgi:hypothetical protein